MKHGRTGIEHMPHAVFIFSHRAERDRQNRAARQQPFHHLLACQQPGQQRVPLTSFQSAFRRVADHGGKRAGGNDA